MTRVVLLSLLFTLVPCCSGVCAHLTHPNGPTHCYICHSSLLTHHRYPDLIDRPQGQPAHVDREPGEPAAAQGAGHRAPAAGEEAAGELTLAQSYRGRLLPRCASALVGMAVFSVLNLFILLPYLWRPILTLAAVSACVDFLGVITANVTGSSCGSAGAPSAAPSTSSAASAASAPTSAVAPSLGGGHSSALASASSNGVSSGSYGGSGASSSAGTTASAAAAAVSNRLKDIRGHEYYLVVFLIPVVLYYTIGG